MSCPRCNTSSEPADTTCRSCHALIAAVPVPFFRGADDWHHPSAPPPPVIAASHDLASQFEDPIFDLQGEAKQPLVIIAPPPDEDAHTIETPAPPPPAPPEAKPATVDVALAPPWRRLAAGAIDALPIGGALMLMLLLFERDLEAGGAPLVPTSLYDLSRVFLSLGARGWLILAVVCLVAIAYHGLSLAFMRATVGDMIFGIRWLTLQGEPPRLARSMTRALIAVPSWLFAMAGVWYVLLSRTQRTLYDTLTGCYPVLR